MWGRVCLQDVKKGHYNCIMIVKMIYRLPFAGGTLIKRPPSSLIHNDGETMLIVARSDRRTGGDEDVGRYLYVQSPFSKVHFGMLLAHSRQELAPAQSHFSLVMQGVCAINNRMSH